MLSAPLLSKAQGLRFSVLAEPQFSWMVPDMKDVTSRGAIVGINTGIGMDFYFAENYAFSTGLTINNLGGKLQYAGSHSFSVNTDTVYVPAGNTITYNLQYINVPFGLKFKTNEIGYVTYFANLGVTPMINIRDRASDVSKTLVKDNISEDINLFNMNYFINMGVQYSLGGSSALIGGLGYSSGFMDVTTLSADKITINTFTIKFGILF
jgi:hypothetical protein